MILIDIMEFEKCTTEKHIPGGHVRFRCKLGIWEVTGPKGDFTKSEAMYYFQQYRDDGEYSSILGGESVFDKMLGGRDERAR